MEELKKYKIKTEFSHIKPTHVVKIKECQYNDYLGNPLVNVGDKMPSVEWDLGYKVLCLDGEYRYMSVMLGDIEVVGTFKMIGEVENG